MTARVAEGGSQGGSKGDSESGSKGGSEGGRTGDRMRDTSSFCPLSSSSSMLLCMSSLTSLTWVGEGAGKLTQDGVWAGSVEGWGWGVGRGEGGEGAWAGRADRAGRAEASWAATPGPTPLPACPSS